MTRPTDDDLIALLRDALRDGQADLCWRNEMGVLTLDLARYSREKNDLLLRLWGAAEALRQEGR